MFRGFRRIFTFSATAMLLAALGAHAQQMPAGRISGDVVDSTGAAVAGAKVVVTNMDTQAARTVTTDAKGFYSVEELPIGRYQVAATQTGFKRAAQSGLNLTADARLTANFTLQIGELTETVEVQAQAEQLNTVSGEVAHTIDQQQVNNLPLNGRNYMELLTLLPGATVTNPDEFSVMTSLSATNQVVNGHRSNENNVTVDGLGNLDNGSNGSLINNVSPSFMQEVKIETSNFSAEYGRSTGAAFNIATKSGTNQFHGGLFE
ncbi:MAG: carboxypeptidase regulatory-like domain-containing protein, partial [Bryobacteraceae bacterium]